MKAFRFSLESALRWRKAQSVQEDDKLTRLLADQQRLEAEVRALDATRRMAAREYLSAPSLTGSDIRIMATYTAGLQAQYDQFQIKLTHAGELVRRQRLKCREAERAVELLENLKKKHHAGWRREADLELDTLAAESYLSRRVREDA